MTQERQENEGWKDEAGEPTTPEKALFGRELPSTPMTTHQSQESWEDRVINEFRRKWGRFYYSDLVGMDWEKPKKPNFRPDEEAQIFGSDGKCIASGDIEKDLIQTISQTRLQAIEEYRQELEGKCEGTGKKCKKGKCIIGTLGRCVVCERK